MGGAPDACPKAACLNQSQGETVYRRGDSVLVRDDDWTREYKGVVRERTPEGYKVQFDNEIDVHEWPFTPGALQLLSRRRVRSRRMLSDIKHVMDRLVRMEAQY